MKAVNPQMIDSFAKTLNCYERVQNYGHYNALFFQTRFTLMMKLIWSASIDLVWQFEAIQQWKLRDFACSADFKL